MVEGKGNKDRQFPSRTISCLNSFMCFVLNHSRDRRQNGEDQRVRVQGRLRPPCPFGTCAGQCGAFASWSAGGRRSAVGPGSRIPFGKRPTRPHVGVSLPGARPLRASSRDHPGLRAHSPTGLLYT